MEGPSARGTADLSANFEATGRSPATLVSSITGGGVLSLHNVVAQYVNPHAVRAIIRTSDLGETFSDDALRDTVEQQIDSGSLALSDTGAAFTVAGGTVRINGLTARGEGVEVNGGAVIDLAALSIDSNWTLTFDTGETSADVRAYYQLLLGQRCSPPARSNSLKPQRLLRALTGLW